ncbi:receptor expression-enhancing protein 2-like [Malaya genurostris]|uniref:receptor expression-enhancing protein 2-like n=1 Tax=Malaya genurostris TaxID=325434 RepID=UPI0026F3BC13|nr:receptor expression-enhancing protein 2-like [Malaya genurostris]
MYWIVFAFFTCVETFTDILLSWFPCYYVIKVIIVLWLLLPATRGSSNLYRKFVHPMLTRREQEIDDYINQAKEKGYTAVLQLDSNQGFYIAPHMPSMMRQSHSDDTLASATHGSRRTYSLSCGIQSTQVDGSEPSTIASRVRRYHSADSALNKASSTHAQPSAPNHSIIYELDTEEEEQLLASAVQKRKTAATRGKNATNGTNGTAAPKTTRGRKKPRKDSETMEIDVDD